MAEQNSDMNRWLRQRAGRNTAEKPEKQPQPKDGESKAINEMIRRLAGRAPAEKEK